MLVGRNEPHALSALGPYSDLADKFGADFLLLAHGQWIAVQRKEVRDLVASTRDGRIKDLRERSSEVGRAVLLVEGSFEWSYVLGCHEEMSRRCPGFTRAMWTGIQLAIQQAGIWLVRTDDLLDTAQTLVQMESWFVKAEHGSLFREPRSKEPPEVQMWRFLGVGQKTAEVLHQNLGSPFMFREDITEETLMAQPGIAKKRAAMILAAGRNNHHGH